MLQDKIIKMHVWFPSKTSKLARTADIQKEFWDIWREFKDEIKSIGLYPRKINEDWLLITNVDKLVKSIDKHMIDFNKKIKSKKKYDEYDETKYKIKDKDRLKDYQIPHVKKIMYFLEQNNAALDTSPTGSGKTYIALNLAHSLGIKPYIITSKKGIKEWNDAIELYGYDIIKVINYEKIRSSGDEYITKIEKEVKSKKQLKKGEKKKYKYSFKFDDRIKLVIFDEAHKCKNPKSLQSLILKAATKQDITRLLQSATIAESPIEFRMTGYALNLFDKPGDFMWWSKKFGVGFIQRLRSFTFNMKSPSAKIHINKLHELLNVTCASRMHEETYEHHTTKNNIIPLVCKIHPDQLKIMIDKYKILNQAVSTRKKIVSMRQKLTIRTNDTLSKLSTGISDFGYTDMDWYTNYFAELGINIKTTKDMYTYSDSLISLLSSDNMDKLKAIGEFRREIEEMKIPIFKTLTDKFSGKGKYVINFFNYRDTAIKLSELLGCDLIIGGQKNEARNIIINNFNNGTINKIVATSKTANESMSLHDTQGDKPRVSLINPDFSGTNQLQILGRSSRSGSMSDTYQYIIYIAGTYEENVFEIAKNDMENIGSLNKGNKHQSVFKKARVLNTIFE